MTEPEYAAKLADLQSIIDRFNTTPREELSYRDYQALMSGRDRFSSMRGKALEALVPISALCLIQIAFVAQDTRLVHAACRWVLRGLLPEKAITKARVDARQPSIGATLSAANQGDAADHCNSALANHQSSESESSSNYKVRNLDAADLAHLAAIDQDANYRWGLRRFREMMAARHIIGMVAYFAEQIAGYLLYVVHDTTTKKHRRQNRMHWQVDVVKVGVAASWRRRGCGTFLIDMLQRGVCHQLSEANAADRLKMTVMVTVPERKLAAQLWLKKNGFIVPQNGIRRDAFEDGDGYRFERRQY